MSTETIGSRAGGQTVRDNWFNIIKSALSGDFLPRNPSGVPTDEAGSLGTEVYRWLKAYIVCGEWQTGDIKVHHSFNDEAEPGEGWMLCDGRVINQANYDTEHGAGAWAAYVGTSPLDGKYLPNFTNRYPIGADTTTQTGASAITPVGNASNQADLSHTHKYLHPNGTSAPTKIYNSSGNQIDVAFSGGKNSSSLYRGLSEASSSNGITAIAQNLYLKKDGSTTQSIQPDSIEVQYYMRII